MKLDRSNFYIVLELISNFFLLNLLWLIMCLPVITIFPSTAAMFGVVREWVLKKDSSVFTSFFRCFKENFKQSFFLGILLSMVIGLLYANFTLISQLSATGKTLLISILFLTVILATFSSVYLFPVMVHYQLNWIGILKNSFLLSISYLPFTLLLLGIFMLMIAAFLWQPVTFFLLFSVGAYFIFFICNKAFLKIEQVKITQ
ncbi:YesL family protein [Mesobacillus foraminis]|uniref:Putative membrane protein YesL n=1 Tax=Mesobacillus foraminis TaxID=279826 RepID=A0A4R2B7K0_9BACI|nr:DUF624 domain-containing protein [Mesobacillus foraminis]TCN22678.1 putative membrane protein YesL [Mesobacillus foraminis]